MIRFDLSGLEFGNLFGRVGHLLGLLLLLHAAMRRETASQLKSLFTIPHRADSPRGGLKDMDLFF